jgi:cell wall-associated NlpC family hydrolase
MAQTEKQVATARQQLKAQAVLAYLAGGAPLISIVPGQAGSDPSLMASYAQIVAGGRKSAEAAYRAALGQQKDQSAQLAATANSASITLADLRSDQSAAQSTLVARQSDLARVKGQLAVAVAQVEAARQQAEAAQVQATLASEGQLPPPAGGPIQVTAGLTAASPTGPGVPSQALPATTATSPPPARKSPATTSPAPAPTSPATTRPTAPAPARATTTPPTTSPPAPPPAFTGPNQAAPGATTAIAYARAQLGKPYQWGGAGPASFDCSGLVMMAWAQAGVYFPHLAQDQYDMTTRIRLSDLLPGDLVFFGTPNDVYHVGIYIGGGNMIDAPETGQDVSVSTIYWNGLLGAGRVKS